MSNRSKNKEKAVRGQISASQDLSNAQVRMLIRGFAPVMGVNLDGVKVSSGKAETYKKGGATYQNIDKNGFTYPTEIYVRNTGNRPQVIHTVFHELAHAMPHKKNPWQSEEVQAECIAAYFDKVYNNDFVSWAYPTEILFILPRLKEFDEFSDCRTLADFGLTFWKMRESGEAEDFIKKAADLDFDDSFYIDYLERAEYMDEFMEYADRELPGEEWSELIPEIGGAVAFLEGGGSILDFWDNGVATIWLRYVMDREAA